MTGYTLTAGYQSGGNKADAWQRLKQTALRLCETPDAIAAEVERLEPGRYSGEERAEYAAAYALRQDLTITFRDDPDDPAIHQSASGGGRGRELKEAMRRAFCRLVIEAMHRERIEVNMIVA